MFGAANSYASYHWYHDLWMECLSELHDDPLWHANMTCSHIDTNSALTCTSDVLDDNAFLYSQMKLGWTNGTNCPITKNEGTVTVNGEVSALQTMQVSMGSGESHSLNVEASMESKNKTGGKVGYNPTWTSEESESFSDSITVGAGISDQNPTVTVPAGKSLLWNVNIYGKQGSSSYEIRKLHYCPTVVCPDTGCWALGIGFSTYYSDHNALKGAGSANGKKPYSVQLVYMGVGDWNP